MWRTRVILGAAAEATLKFPAVKNALNTWLLLFSLMLQAVSWVLPPERVEQTERLSHLVDHAVDHGHHRHLKEHDAWGHEVDQALLISEIEDLEDQGLHHVHAAEGAQSPGLPVTSPPSSITLPATAPAVALEAQPPSTDPDSLLRPPQVAA